MSLVVRVIVERTHQIAVLRVIVEADDRVTALQQLGNHILSDESSRTGYQYP
jgi:hypothetical protein